MNNRRLLILTASLAVSVTLLLVVLRDVPMSEVANSIGAADPGYLLLALALTALSLFIRGIRWSVLLDRRITYVEATHMVNVMFLGNQLPLRLGEVARSVLATRKRVPLGTSASSIVVERLIDTLVVVLMIAVSVGQSPELTERASLFGLLALVGFISLLGLARFPQVAHRIVDRLLLLMPPAARLTLKSLLIDVLDGLQPLTQVRTLAIVAFWTALAWIVSVFTYYCLHLALGIEVDYARSVPLGISLAALALALPVSIAGLGPFEGAIVVSGQIVGMDPLEAISLGFLYHGLSVLSFALWGTVGLLALGVSPGSAFSPMDGDSEEEVTSK